MGNLSWLILDAALVIVAITLVARNVRRGFMAALVQFVGTLAAAALAAVIGRFASLLIFESFIRQPLLDALGQVRGVPPVEAIGYALGELPGVFVNLLKFAYGDNLASQIVDAYQTKASGASAYIVDEMVKPIVTSAVAFLAFLIFFALLMLVVRFAARALKSVNNIPIIGPLNMILGGIFGVLIAYIVLMVIVLSIQAFLSFTNNGGVLINSKLLGRTYVYRFLALFNPIELLLYA